MYSKKRVVYSYKIHHYLVSIENALRVKDGVSCCSRSDDERIGRLTLSVVPGVRSNESCNPISLPRDRI